MVVQGALEPRKAPYTTLKSLQEFLDRIRGISTPDRVDRKFLQRIGVGKNSEWALLSALKFLRIVDYNGFPTPTYRRLQTDGWQAALRELVIDSYRPLLDLGGLKMNQQSLRNYFALEHSASQASNAARFFRESSKLADLQEYRPAQQSLPWAEKADDVSAGAGEPNAPERTARNADLLAAKRRVMDSLPQAAQVNWSAEEYMAVFERVLTILQNLDATS